VVEDGARCVLCQQDLDHAAAHRLKQFEDFEASTVERELRQIREDFARRRKAFADLKTTTEAVEERSRRYESSTRPRRTSSGRDWRRMRDGGRLLFWLSATTTIWPLTAPPS
jgi:hypothetical protein